MAVGSFLFAAFLVPPQDNGVLDVDGYRAVRVGTVAAGTWAVCAALLVPLTISDVSGQPITAHLNPATLWSLASLINISSAWRWTALLAAAVMLASLPVLRWSWTPLLLARVLGDPDTARADRPLVGRRFARPGHQQPADPSGRRRACGPVACWRCWPTSFRGGQHADLASRRFSSDRVVVLCRDGGQRSRQRRWCGFCRRTC